MEPVVIIALIGALASLGGAVIVATSARGTKKVDYKTALDARIDKRVSEQLATAWAQLDTQKDQITGLTEQNARQSRIERVLYRYVSDLRKHIHTGAPPPPPPVPTELIEWYEANASGSK